MLVSNIYIAFSTADDPASGVKKVDTQPARNFLLLAAAHGGAAPLSTARILCYPRPSPGRGPTI